MKIGYVNEVDVIVESLQMHFAKHVNARCLLMVDPSRCALEDCLEEDVLFSQYPQVRIAIRHKQFPKNHYPYLIQLNPSKYQDARVLRESVHIALKDRDSGSMVRGHGQRVGGWLTCTQPAPIVSTYLSNQILLRDETGRQSALRFYDARVLTLLWPILRPGQRGALLGPVLTWHALDACAQLHAYACDEVADSHLHLDSDQWEECHRIGLVNKALAQYYFEKNCQISRQEVANAVAAAIRANMHGIQGEEDQVAFIQHALAWHPQFDRHPVVRLLIQKAVCEGHHYSAVIEELTAEVCEQVRMGSWVNQVQGELS